MALTRPLYNNLNTNVEVFNDAITVLHGASGSATTDVGFLINRAHGLVANTAIYWNEATQSFVTAFTANSGATDTNISVISYANITTGNVHATAYFYANGMAFVGGGGGSTPGGLSGQLQYNNSGTLAGANISFVSANSTLISTTSNIITSGNMFVGGNLYVQGNLNYVNTTIVNENLPGNVTVGNIISGNILTNVPVTGQGNTIYVSASTGNDSNSGLFNAPFKTIKAALAAATAGSTVQVGPGTYNENNPVTIPHDVSLMGNDLRTVFVTPQNPDSDLFYVTNGCYVWGLTIKSYHANGFAYSSSTSSQNVYVSPYIQNLTSSTTYPGATAVMVDGNYTSSTSTKAMIVGFFTIINQAGVGVHLTNMAYSQLVNIYTIGANVGVWAESGSFCTLNGSDSSIGNIGLRADGYGPLQSYGSTTGYSTGGSFTISNPTTPPHVNQVVVVQGDSNFYTIDTISKKDAVTYQVNILETYTGNLAPGSNILFYQRSEVLASAHTFEYVGAGTNPATALPQYGGYPNANLNVVSTNGGRVSYTATDEKGNFYIGSNLIVNQSTATIAGDAFNKSLFAQMTPYILALSDY